RAGARGRAVSRALVGLRGPAAAGPQSERRIWLWRGPASLGGPEAGALAPGASQSAERRTFRCAGCPGPDPRGARELAGSDTPQAAIARKRRGRAARAPALG